LRENLTYAPDTSRSSNRVLTVLVTITIVIVAWWAMTGGLDEIETPATDTAVVSD
jgi:hypothetical protein